MRALEAIALLTAPCRRECYFRCTPRPSGGIGRRAALKMRYRKVCGFESHLGHSVSAGQTLFILLLLTKLDFPPSKVLLRATIPVVGGRCSDVREMALGPRSRPRANISAPLFPGDVGVTGHIARHIQRIVFGRACATCPVLGTPDSRIPVKDPADPEEARRIMGPSPSTFVGLPGGPEVRHSPGCEVKWFRSSTRRTLWTG
jgi:hypothetical protein